MTPDDRSDALNMNAIFGRKQPGWLIALGISIILPLSASAQTAAPANATEIDAPGRPSGKIAHSPAPSLVYSAETRSSPRPLRIHVLRLDLRDPGYALDVVIGRDPDGAGPAEAELTPPPRLLDTPDIVAAINANAFAYAGPPRPKERAAWSPGDPVAITGWAKSLHREASRAATREIASSFWVGADGRARIGPLEPQDPARLAIAGFSPLVTDGRVTATSAQPLHPRTAIGVDPTGFRVVMVVVDGRQPDYSEGMSLLELAELMHSLGCHQALNLDGGGSSILYYRGHDGWLGIKNRPSGILPRPIPVMLVVRCLQSP